MFVFKYLLFGVVLLGTVTYGSVGKISAQKGETVLEREQQPISVKSGLAIEKKDTVKTGRDGHVQMVFVDKTVITLGSSTIFSVEEYLFDEINAKAKFSIGSGIFKAITGKIGKQAPENFSIRTKTAVIGIRGTIIRGKIGNDTDIIMCEEGVISVTSLITGEVYLIPAGKMIILSHDGTSVEVRDASIEDIRGLGLEEEFLLRSSSIQATDVRSEDMQSVGPMPLSPFESPSFGLQDLIPSTATGAVDRNLQTIHNETQSQSQSQQGGPTAGPQ